MKKKRKNNNANIGCIINMNLNMLALPCSRVPLLHGKMSTYNQLVLETLESQPIMLKNHPGHSWYWTLMPKPTTRLVGIG